MFSHNRIIITLLAGTLGMCTCIRADQLTINVNQAGNLRTLLEGKTDGLSGLKLTGDLNGTDILYLRELSGSNLEGDRTESGVLQHLDMSGAHIVQGGDPYYSFYWDEYFSEDNKIGISMFANCHTLVDVTLPADVTELCENAFNEATNLEQISFGENVTSIGEMAFSQTGLKEVALPQSVATLGDMAFYACAALKRAKLSDNIEQIGYGTFYFCSALEEVNIPAKAQSIGVNAFHSCTSLKRIAIPASVTDLSDAAFGWCTALEAYDVNPENPNYSSIDGVLFNKDASTLYKYPAGKTSEGYSIPASVTEIGYSSFEESVLVHLVMDNNVTTIGANAFFNCKKLEDIVLSTSLVSIPRQCFFGCQQLKSLTIPASVETLGESAFMTAGLESIIIPNSISSLPEDCFYGCENLASVHIPASVNKISDRAFYNCIALKAIRCDNPEPPACESASSFNNVDRNTCQIDVPAGSVDAYAKAAIWSEFKKISEINPSGISEISNCTDVVVTARYTLDGKRVETPVPGINIVVLSDGTHRKEIVR